MSIAAPIFFAMVVVSAQPGAAPASSSARPAEVARAGKPSLEAADKVAIDGILTPFFAALVAGENSKAFEGLGKSFAIAVEKRDYLAERSGELEKRLGRAVSFERLGFRRLPGSSRLVAVYVATHHPLKPAVWEIVCYRAPATAETPERWMVTSLRFETEQLFEWLQGVEP